VNGDPGEKPRVNRSLTIIIAAAVVLVLLLIAACGGVIFMGANLFSKFASQGMNAAAQMTEFFAELQGGKIDAAYARTSTGFRKRMSLEAFRQFVDSQPTLKKPGSVSNNQMNFNASAGKAPSGIPDPNAEGTRITMSGLVNSSDSSVSYSLEMIREGDSWKIDQITYAGKKLPPDSAEQRK
jgi:hypothetical protein